MSVEPAADQCHVLLGDEGEQGRAWTGLIRAHRHLVRRLESELQERHQLSLGALELLARLAQADEERLRIARLAEQAELSLSRTSRILDGLTQRGLVRRVPCPEDSRATLVELTPAGRTLARAAQADHRAQVQREFFDRLTELQAQTLAEAFARLA